MNLLLEVGITSPNPCSVTFPVRNGIYGVDLLARHLIALAEDKQIGEWHIDRWVDWKHTAIRIRFDTVADAGRAEFSCSDLGNSPDVQPQTSHQAGRAYARND